MFYKCGKRDHIKSDCKKVVLGTQIVMMATKNERKEVSNELTMVDSGCTVHLVKDTSLLDPGSMNQASGSLRLSERKKIQNSVIGKRSMEVGEHRIQLQNLYYAEAVRQNLFSVKAVAAEGASVTLGEKEAYVTKGNLKINLSRGEDAWYLPK